MPAIARRLAAKHWPGGLTIVLNRDPGWPGDLADDGTTIGVRCPDHPWVRQLCELMGPVAASSANVHGQPTVTTAAEAAGVFGTAVAIVVDGGHCQGAPSTVVDCTVAPAVVRRSGRVALTPSELA
jgi:L-threonylcarbamoyladenylate synthase